MICIPIRFPDQESRWVLIELQGTLHNSDGGALNSKILGSLEWNNGIPSLTIGNHLCEGKVVKLRTPLAILRKSFSADPAEVVQKEYLVQAIVREKLLFSDRPRPLLQSLVSNKQNTRHLKSYPLVQYRQTPRSLFGREVSASPRCPSPRFGCFAGGRAASTRPRFVQERRRTTVASSASGCSEA